MKRPWQNRSLNRVACAAISLFSMALGAVAHANELDVIIYERGGDGQIAECAISIVDGLKEDGDNFLSVRSGPGTTFRKIDELKNGDYVFVFDDHGDWLGVIYGSGKDVLSQDEIGCGFVGEGTRPMTYPGKKGWIHMNWVVPSDIG
ncbi:MAG: SH3 domain-containing protein [Pelagimonas sp.]|uniref:SH3 domain-containing protein n=1 Tax=Pelagimonas sp. TaxID=2073170 RepID=UPI003D6ABAF7